MNAGTAGISLPSAPVRRWPPAVGDNRYGGRIGTGRPTRTAGATWRSSGAASSPGSSTIRGSVVWSTRGPTSAAPCGSTIAPGAGCSCCDWIGWDEWNLSGVESLALDPADPHGCTLPSAPTPTSGRRSTARSCDRATRDGPSSAPTCRSSSAATSPAARWASDSSSTRATAACCYFGTRNQGLWRSADRGVTWARVDSFPVTGNPGIGIGFVFFDPGRDGPTIYAGVADPANPLVPQHRRRPHLVGGPRTADRAVAPSRRTGGRRQHLRHLRRSPRAVRDVRRRRPQAEHRDRRVDRHHPAAAEHRW